MLLYGNVLRKLAREKNGYKVGVYCIKCVTAIIGIKCYPIIKYHVNFVDVVYVIIMLVSSPCFGDLQVSQL